MSSLNAMAPWLASIGSRLGESTTPHFWRSLDELADDPAFVAQVRETLPAWQDFAPMDRRAFLKLLGASLAMAGLVACSRPSADAIVPWWREPDDRPDDGAIFYATTLAMAGDVAGVLVQTNQGRPTKIEGNPAHPASLGATGPLLQAAVLELWDPDRSATPWYQGEIASWDSFAAQAAGWTQQFSSDGGGLRILSAPLRSPSLIAQRDALLQRFPGAHWHTHAAVDTSAMIDGSIAVFGKPYDLRYRLRDADVILALEADLLAAGPGHLAYARDFAMRRDPNNSAGMNRLYAVEATPSVTGAMADHRWSVPSSQIGDVLLALAARLGITPPMPAPTNVLDAARLDAVADDLATHRGRSLIAVGMTQPKHVHALAHRINLHLGNAGLTVDYLPAPVQDEDLESLCVAMHGGKVQCLLMLDVNPCYDAPAELDFLASLTRVPHVIHHGLYRDETAHVAQWHLPATHALETWSDLTAFDGTTSLVQPVIEPLYQGRSVHELLAMLMGETEQRGREIVRARWSQLDDVAWKTALRDGVIAEVSLPTAAVTPVATGVPAWPATAATSDLELVFRPDSLLHDGRYANNGWLQECPRPLSQLTWGNVAWISPALAAAHGWVDGDHVRLRLGQRSIVIPIGIMPGQSTHTVTLHLGYGRRQAGAVGDGVGISAYELRERARPWIAAGLSLEKSDGHTELASTQAHARMETREPVRSLSLAELAALVQHQGTLNEGTPATLYGESQEQGDVAWGMTIDLNACIGCKGCTVACQAENNIPVVGAEQVRHGRQMHWMRVDRYYAGPADAPTTYHQPVPCMHCEHAPCELVCPVGATMHDSDGLNVQVYNRCVGTRFCSNNCPYKVRRFNFLQFSDLTSESLKAQRNPEVSVRNRGVMEKCTYCIQRIEKAHIAADRDGRRIADGDVVTACQAACPTQAIRFGNLKDRGSAVAATKASPRRYDLLAELNTRPRTSYLAHVRNRHPSLGEDA